MLIPIPDVLTSGEVAAFRARLAKAKWVDGNETSGHQSAQAKYNEQIPENSDDARELGELVLQALARNKLFFTAALPRQVYPPLFNRYGVGMTFGSHVDSAIRAHPNMPVRIRTDLSATLFLTPPEDYDGGELLVEDVYGPQKVKLPAGHMVLYPATSLHTVTPITRGTRTGCFFWVQSMVRDDAQRAMLFDLDMAIMRLTKENQGSPAMVSLVGVYHNLLRMWAET